MLAFVIFLIKPDKKTPTINTSSFVKSQTLNSEINTSKTKNTKKIQSLTTPKEVNQTSDSLYIDPELSYLEAFRQYTFFALCAEIIIDLEQNKNPIDSFRIEIDKNKKYGYAGGIVHEQFFLKHVENCKNSLISNHETLEQAFARLKLTYESIEPKTKTEKELSKNVVLFDQANELHKKWVDVRKGISTLSPKAIDLLKLKIQTFRDLNKPLFNIPKHLRTDTQLKIIQLNIEKINSLRNQIRSSYQYDTELTQSLLNDYTQSKTFLDRNITSIKSPDIYALISRRISSKYIARPFAIMYEPIIIDHSKTVSSFKDNYYLNILSESAFPLFACALGYPCDQDSQITLYHCIHLTNRDACGKSVEDFYLNHYISPNIQTDVNEFLNFLFEYYAKE